MRRMIQRIMKNIYHCFYGCLFFMLACGPAENKQAPVTTAAADSERMTIPGVEKLNYSDTILLKADEKMRFDKELFRVRAARKIKLQFFNTEKKSAMSMTHNVVVLKKGTDIADFADAVHNAKAEQYVPASVGPLVISHTRLVGGGETDSIEFILPKPGIYDFICSFPGHWGTMQGKIVAQ